MENGRAVESALLRGDDELLGWLHPRTREACVVAFDAPLIIPNDTGARGCERAITRGFGRHEAGCHPANRTRVPERALSLADQLGLDPDPTFRAGDTTVRRAIEVYPHAALVTLFWLDRTIKYKAGKGRTVVSRHAAFRRLTAHLETLVEHDPPLTVQAAPRWRGLVHAATSSPVGAELDRAEDEIDAFACAYVALLYWTYGTDRCAVFGSLQAGYIVTPC